MVVVLKSDINLDINKFSSSFFGSINRDSRYLWKVESWYVEENLIYSVASLFGSSSWSMVAFGKLKLIDNYE